MPSAEHSEKTTGTGRPGRRTILLLVVLAALIALGFSATRQQLKSGNDFPIYVTAASDLLGGNSPYDVDSGLHGYVYLPFLALVLIPLSLIPLGVAVWIWHAIGCVAVVLTIHRTRVILHDQLGRPPAIWIELLSILAIGRFFVDNLALGQVNAIIFCLLLYSVRDVSRSAGQSCLSGALIGIACAIKPYGAFFLVPLLARRRWRAVVTAGATLVVLNVGLPAAVVGPRLTGQLLTDWYAKIVEPTLEGTLQGSKIWDQSPAAGLRRLVVDEPAFDDVHVNVASLSQHQFHILSRILTLVLAGLLVFAWFRSRPPGPVVRGHDAVIVSIAMVLLVGYNLKAHFVGLYLPHAWVAARVIGAKARPDAATVAFCASTAILVLAAPTFVGRQLSNLLYAWSAITVAVLLLVIAIAGLRDGAGPTATGD